MKLSSIRRAGDSTSLSCGSGYVVALVGNPNTGKSTVFNNLTGLKQHTGNWPGKTVALAKGIYTWKEKVFAVVDLPGIYSLLGTSEDERIASDFITHEAPDVVVLVLDATSLERNLGLALQVMHMTSRVVICLNLMDEAQNMGIEIDCAALEAKLAVPVIPCVARSGKGMSALKDSILKTAEARDIQIRGGGRLALCQYHACEEITRLDGTRRDQGRVLPGCYRDSGEDLTAAAVYSLAERIASEVVKRHRGWEGTWHDRLDAILTSRQLGIPIMVLLLAFIFWVTLWGANVPSELLARVLFAFQDRLSAFVLKLGGPQWLHGVLVLGMYRTVAWVVSVMLPPMAIFFPLFTLMEDLGYLPRVAFNLDYLFKKSGGHGKQALTMSMGLGCNAVGVTACRIIESPREKIIAVLTNVFMPCNGRFPTIIALSSIFMSDIWFRGSPALTSTFMVLLLVLVGVLITLLVSKILTLTVLKGMPSLFVLEMPSYRPPQVLRVLVRSVLDRTIFVLGRAAALAAPAGAITWILTNTRIQGVSLFSYASNLLSPAAGIIGLDGTSLLAFILGFPANEIVLPIVVMVYSSRGALIRIDSLETLAGVLMANGWTRMTAISFMLFSLLHWPCSTTLWTIKKETQSWRWTFAAMLIPTVTAALIIIAFRSSAWFAQSIIKWLF